MAMAFSTTREAMYLHTVYFLPFISIYLLYVSECSACIYVSAPHVWLEPMEVRREVRSPGTRHL